MCADYINLQRLGQVFFINIHQQDQYTCIHIYYDAVQYIYFLQFLQI